MAKLIFTSRYLRDVPAPRIEHYVRYIRTREGVEKMAGGRDNLPATKNQKQYIEEMVRNRELLFHPFGKGADPASRFQPEAV